MTELDALQHAFVWNKAGEALAAKIQLQEGLEQVVAAMLAGSELCTAVAASYANMAEHMKNADA